MEFSTQGYRFAVNPLWANVFWKIGFGKRSPPPRSAPRMPSGCDLIGMVLGRCRSSFDLPRAEVGAVQDRDEGEGGRAVL